jgi:hypothetical protein
VNWLEKVRTLRDLKKSLKTGEPRVDIFLCEPSWSEEELENLENELPWIPKSYINYIAEFDSTNVGWCNFFGSQKCNGIPLQKQIEEHKALLKNEYLPFGKHHDRSIFLLNKHGEVLWWDKHDYDFTSPKFIAGSFEEFMDECLLGKRYEEFSSTKVSTLYKLLQVRGWA